MSATAAPQARRFRLSPLDPTGLMFGLGFVQLTLVAAGVLAGSILMVTYSVSLGFIVLIVGSGLGLFRLHGASVVDLAPPRHPLPAPTNKRTGNLVLGRATHPRQRSSGPTRSRRPRRDRRRPRTTRARSAGRRDRHIPRPQGRNLRRNATSRRTTVRTDRQRRTGLARHPIGYRALGLHRGADTGGERSLVRMGSTRRARGTPALAHRAPRR